MKKQKENKVSLTSIFKTNKFKHGTTTTIFTAVFIAVVILVNMFASALVERFPSLNADLTAEGLYTLSEDSIEVAESVEIETEIIIIGTQEDIENDVLYSSYGIPYSQVSTLSYKLSEINSNITVSYVDPDLEPQLISEYASDSLTDGKVLVRSGLRYTVLSVTDLFYVTQDSSTYEYYYYSLVDGALANAINLVNLEDVPVIAVATGHDELLSTDVRATFDTLVEDNGFVVQEFDILTEEIPEDADIVMIATPSTDYSTDEIAKLTAFLADVDAGDAKTVMVTCYPSQDELPNLSAFLEEWGLIVGEGAVLETDTNSYLSGYAAYVLVDITSEWLESYSYSNVVSAFSSPITFAFDANNGIATYSLIETSDTAYVSSDGSESEDPVTGVQITCALGQKYEYISNVATTSNVLVFGDSIQFTSDFLGSSAFDNRELIVNILQIVTQTEEADLSLYIDSIELNTVDVVASTGTIIVVGIYIFTIAVPLAVLLAGLVIFLRRRHL